MWQHDAEPPAHPVAVPAAGISRVAHPREKPELWYLRVRPDDVSRRHWSIVFYGTKSDMWAAKREIRREHGHVSCEHKRVEGAYILGALPRRELVECCLDITPVDPNDEEENEP